MLKRGVRGGKAKLDLIRYCNKISFAILYQIRLNNAIVPPTAKANLRISMVAMFFLPATALSATMAAHHEKMHDEDEHHHQEKGDIAFYAQGREKKD